MQHLELITDWESRLRVIRIMQSVWTDEYLRKQGFRDYVLRVYGIQLGIERLDEGTVTVVSASVVDSSKYSLFLLKWGQYV